MNSEYNPELSDTYPQTEQAIRINYTIEKPNFFLKDKIFNEYITNHNEKCYLYSIKCDFKLFFNNDFSKPIHVKTYFYGKTSLILLKKCSIYQIDNFIEKGLKFSHIDEMKIISVNDKMYMTYEYYLKNPMPAVEFKVNMIIIKNLHLKKSLNRSHIHPLIRKYSHIR